MSAPDPNPFDLAPDTCGCCEGAPAPSPVFNRPGQRALQYRIGTHSSFLLRMLAELRVQVIAGGPTLAGLTTRSPDDPAIALLDTWATVADVLTFYQERIANEGFLRTATERRSVLELARAIGYELSPGVAASAYLAFSLQDAPGSPAMVTIPRGTKVQSVPPQGKLPQTFETIEDIQARPAWNALKPKTSAPQVFQAGDRSVFLQGTNTQLQPGDAILIVGDERRNNLPADGTTPENQWAFRILQSVTPFPQLGITLVTWQDGLQGPLAMTNATVYALRQRASIFGYNAPDWRATPDQTKAVFTNYNYKPGASPGTPPSGDPGEWPGLNPITSGSDIDLDAVYPKILAESWVVLVQRFAGLLFPVQEVGVFTALRSKAPVRPIFGASILQQVYLATSVSTTACANFTLAAKATHLELDSSASLSLFGRRETAVYAQSEALAVAERPFTDPAEGTVTLTDPATGASTSPLGGSDGTTIELAALVVGLRSGQTLVVSGKWVRLKVGPLVTNLTLTPEDGSAPVSLSPFDVLRVIDAPAPAPGTLRRWHVVDAKGDVGYVTALSGSFLSQAADKDDPLVSETVVIDHVGLSDDGRYTVLSLKQALQNIYEPATVSIYANVARATHGETVTEVLGGGDGSQRNQRFTLKKPPLTYISAGTPSGAQSTLEVRVNDILWEEMPSLYGLGPRSENYMVRIDDDAKATITFGDGSSGERLPTGQENITATYRSGIGPDGNVDANTLTILQSRPLGVRGATNPLPAGGAAAPEKLDQARTHAPLKILTLDRMVSLEDYEDFASAFAGIGKAQAVALWNGETRLVYITVAGADGSVIDPTSQLFLSLRDAVDRFRDPVQSVQVAAFTRLTFSLQATVLVDPRYLIDKVLDDVKAALLEAFSFDRRDFAQPVTGAEVVTVMQGRPGVVAVNLESLSIDSVPAVQPRFQSALVEFLRATHLFRATTPLLSAGVARTLVQGTVGVQLGGVLSGGPMRILPVSRPPAPQATAPIDSTLGAKSARWENGAIQPAELLVINPIGARLKGKNP